ncbi:MAG: aminoglycoside phosphotransferase family protein [Kibdelosporangium sp.]
MLVNATLAGRLLAAQFPQWGHLAVAPVQPAGTDNAIFRLGPEMTVRFPRAEPAACHVAKEQRWLAELAPMLPLDIPVPLAQGEPGEGYPWRWSVHRWLDGAPATPGRIADLADAARRLGDFVAALQRIDPVGGPSWGRHNGFRGQPLAMRDAETRESIVALSGSIDADLAATAWTAALRTPAWTGPGVWLHGDLHPGNVLAAQGRLAAVIDFGLLATGDPACDLMVAWTVLTAGTREVFRAAVGVDEETWARGRGWALSFALVALAGYAGTDSPLVPVAHHAISEVLTETDPGE